MTPDELSHYSKGAPLTFSEGTLVKTPFSPTVYVVSDRILREIPTEEVFLSLNYDWMSIITVSEQALSIHPIGAPLS